MAKIDQKRKIGEYEVFVGMMPVDDQLDVLCWLMSRYGGSLGAVIDSVSGEEGFSFTKLMDSDMSSFKIGDAVRQIVMNIKNDEVKYHIKLIMEHVQVDNQKANLNAHFQGKIKTLLQVLIFALKVNYQDFFSDAPGENSFNVSVKQGQDMSLAQ